MYQHLEQYVESLPAGLDSYADCIVKASVLRAALETGGLRGPESGLPDRLQRLLDAPPPVTEWIPEVLSVAAHLAIIDENGLSDDAVLDWTYRTNRHLAQSRLYRAVASLASPDMALRASRLGWGMLHRGIELSVQRGNGGAQLTVHHPDSVWTRLVHLATATGFRAVLESSRGKDVSVTLSDSQPDQATYDCTWS
jgi:hypothetical protein